MPLTPTEAKTLKIYLQNSANLIRAESGKFEPGPIHYRNEVIATWSLSSGVPFFQLEDWFRHELKFHRLLPWAV